MPKATYKEHSKDLPRKEEEEGRGVKRKLTLGSICVVLCSNPPTPISVAAAPRRRQEHQQRRQAVRPDDDDAIPGLQPPRHQRRRQPARALAQLAPRNLPHVDVALAHLGHGHLVVALDGGVAREEEVLGDVDAHAVEPAGQA